MKVKDLILKLNQCDPDLEVLCYNEEDEVLQQEGHMFRLLDIIDFSINNGEFERGEDGIVSIKFNDSKNSRKVVLLDVTTKF